MANWYEEKCFVSGYVTYKHGGDVSSFAQIDTAAWDTLTAEQRAEFVSEQLMNNAEGERRIYGYCLNGDCDAEGFERRYSYYEKLDLTLEQLERNGVLGTYWEIRGYSSAEDCVNNEGLDYEVEQDAADGLAEISAKNA